MRAQASGQSVKATSALYAREYIRKGKYVAPFIPVPGVLQANVRFSLEGQQIENVMNFRYDGLPFGAAAAEVWGILDSIWWTGLRVQLSTEISSVEVYIVDQSDEAGPVASLPAFSNPTGAATGSPVPNNAALVITHRTANRGRSYRGRTFVPGIAKSVVNGSYVDTGVVGAIVTTFNNMVDASVTSEVPFTIVSRRHNNAPRVEGIDTIVTLCVARDNVLDSQRRRSPGRGR